MMMMMSYLTYFVQEAEGLVDGVGRQREKVMEAELQHRKALNMWNQQETLLKSQITALLNTKTRNLNYIKELDTRAVKQKELLHSQVGAPC